MLLFPFTVTSVELEKREIDRCISMTGGNPTGTAVCAGKILTTEQINKCINGDCLGENDEIRKAFVSLYVEKPRKKQPCANYEISTINNNVTAFQNDKSWELCSGYKVVFQDNGNLVVYNKSGKALWLSGTRNKGADRLTMQSNGDLIIYKQVYPIWSSGTHGNPGSKLVIQEDGNLAIYNRYQKPIWATGTNGK